MMRRYRAYLTPALLVLSAIAMGMLAFHTGYDRHLHEENLEMMRSIERFDVQLNRDLALSRQGTLANFDPLNHALAGMQQQVGLLQGRFSSLQNRAGARAVLERMRVKLARKESLVFDFNADLAILRNSLTYFPRALEGLHTALHDDVAMLKQRHLDVAMTDLLHAVMVAAQPGVLEIEGPLDIQELVGRLRRLGKDLQQQERVDLEHILRHAEVISRYKPLVEGALTEALSIGLDTDTDQLRSFEVKHYNELVMQTDALRRFLFLVGLAVLGFGLFTWLRLQRSAQELTRSHQDLAESHEQLEEEAKRRWSLYEEMRKLAFAVEQSPVSVVITDPHGVIEYVNSRCCRSTGYARHEMIGQTPAMLKSGDTDNNAYKRLWAEISAGREWKGEFHNKRKDGALYWESASIAPVINDQGAITHFVAVKEDVTERKRLEAEREQDRLALQRAKEEAEAAVRAKSDFLAMMSHEIRTPMNAILGMIELLKEARSAEESEAYLEVQQRAGEALLTIIDDILELSRLEAGVDEVTLSPFDLMDLCRSVVSLVERSAQAKGLTLAVALDPTMGPWWVGDARRIRQVLINLMGNAVKFTASGNVCLSAAPRAEGGVTLSVEDTGIGIPQAHLARIFDSFHQVDSSSARKHGGSGLGLAISRRQMELMGGEITVQSESGKGTRFDLFLPLSEAPREAMLDAASEAPSAAPEEVKPLRILLVEDSPDNALLIQSYLKNTEHQLSLAENGAEAVEATQGAGPFDLILMDMQMPVMDGYEATRRIRAHEAQSSAPRTRIVALTAHALQDDRDKCLSMGCDDYLTKPIRKQTLLEAVKGGIELSAQA
ncbi:DAHL domain-containing protein [Magnetofaba australis]|uniref:histidine kinase n=1 Tax=Magnetofaba australis IT-1 TaxID=1434232 RepID=A0A1Y2JYU6_9PROT|nr:DAHL domain-containing protein [Magnetofaba australis]OSM00067.1 putative PAS/PAC sensor hybrid histidine kinase [Magnetofaba australis IT-1]